MILGERYRYIFMEPDQWAELVAQVESHGPENIRFVIMQNGEYKRYELGEPNDVRYTGRVIEVQFI